MAEESLFHPIEQRLRKTGLIAVVSIDDPASALPLARALIAGGVDCMELTLRTHAALDALKIICNEVPEMTVGAGTVLSPDQALAVQKAGASFAVAPGTNPRVIAQAQKIKLPFAPGVCTPTDIEHAVELGCRVLKFFPSEPSGGLNYLRTVAAPFLHLGIKFIPLGGVGPSNAAAYLKDPAVLALGGSWLAPSNLIAQKDWDQITANAREAAEIARQIRT